MALDRLTGGKPQTQGVSALERLTGCADLLGHLQGFLIACKVEELSPATIVCYRYKIGSFVSFCAQQGITDPKHVTPTHIRMFMLRLQENNKAISVSDYYKCTKRFFNWLEEEGILENSPMAKIRPPKVPEQIIQPFRPEHIEELLLLCDATKFLGLRNKAIIFTFLDTGLRLSELSHIQLADIDFDRETVKVMGKGARERVVRIGKTTQKALLKYLLMRNDKLPCLWVTEERQPLTTEGVRQVIVKLAKRANLQGVRCSPHTFRHTFATRALLNGAGEFDVQSLLGHKKLDMTRRYAATLRSEQAVIAHKHFSPVDNLRLK